MIFVTVGTQLPFDRLVTAVDRWSAARRAASDPVRVFAQIGPTDLVPACVEHARFVEPGRCAELMREADAVVAHAGMGTILTALELGKPLLVMPRREALGEHRSDHQMATARRFAGVGVNVAFDELELAQLLDSLRDGGDGRDGGGGPRIGQSAPQDFLARLAGFISHGEAGSDEHFGWSRVP